MQLKLDQKKIKYFISLLIMSLLYVFPIILADRFYNDDLGRTVTGYTGWNGDGRPAAEVLMRLFHFGRPIVDTFPLTLILGIIVFSYVMTLYIRHNVGDTEMSIVLLFAGFMILANPFFIPNLSYRFDCLFMLLSVSLALLAFSVPYTNSIVEVFVNTAIVLIVLCLFQPSVSVWFSLVFLEVLFSSIRKEPFIKRLILRGIGGIAAAGVYVLIIAPIFVDKQGWRAEASRLSLSPEIILSNFSKAFVIIARFCRGLTIPILIPVAVFAIISIITWLIEINHSYHDEKRLLRIFLCIYVILLPAILLFATVSPLTVLASGRITDHELPGIGVVMLFVGLGAALQKKKGKILVVILLIPCILFQYVYIYAYGNAMKSQKEYEYFITQSIVNDMEMTDAEGTCENIDIIGRMPKSRQLQNACERFPQFEAIIPTYLFAENWIGTMLLNHFSSHQLYWHELSEEEKATLDTRESDVETLVYQLYRIDNSFVVVFR